MVKNPKAKYRDLTDSSYNLSRRTFQLLSGGKTSSEEFKISCEKQVLRNTCRTMKLLLSPHNDDESLFAAYTLIREKPTVLIITDSDMQLDRGISAAQRKEESRRACETLGVPVRFLGLKDGSVTEDDLRQRLLPFTEQEWECVYAPANEGGHPEHDLLGRVASSLFRNVRYYSTYKDPAVPPRGQHAIIPTQEEIDLKNRALDCYASQLSLNDVRVHFDTVRGKTEYLNDSPGHDLVSTSE